MSRLKKIIYAFPLLYAIMSQMRKLHTDDIFCRNLKINNKSKWNGYIKLKKYIHGNNNALEIGENCHLFGTTIHIVGKNNKIIFQDNCIVGSNCSFWMEGNNITITIGANTTFTHTVHFCAQEDNSSIIIGKDCMFSNNIVVRTSDSHPIIDLTTNQRINPAKDVCIGNHIWIAPNTKVMKGAKINDNSIIGSNSMVTNEIPTNCLAVGAPCKVVKTNITWTRDKLF